MMMMMMVMDDYYFVLSRTSVPTSAYCGRNQSVTALQLTRPSKATLGLYRPTPPKPGKRSAALLRTRTIAPVTQLSSFGVSSARFISTTRSYISDSRHYFPYCYLSQKSFAAAKGQSPHFRSHRGQSGVLLAHSHIHLRLPAACA